MTPGQQAAIRAAHQRAAIQAAEARGGVSTAPGAVDDFKSKMGALVDGAHNGITFGHGDTLAGVKGAVFGQNTQEDGNLSADFSGTMADRYASERDKYREQQDQSQAENPNTYGGGNIMGAAVPAIAGGLLTGGQSMLGQAGYGMGIGAIEGALHGTGNADGKDVLTQGAKGALVGAGAGALAPVAVGAAGAIKNAAKDPVTGVVDALVGRANTGKANRAIMDAMRQSKKTPDELGQAVMRAAQEGQPEYRMMDAMGLPGQRSASGVARLGGEPGADIADFLNKRQAGQGERVAGFVDEGFGMNGETAKQAVGRMTADRKSAADAAYDAARGNAAPVDVRGALGVIDDRIGGMNGSNITGDSIDAKLAGYRNRLAADPAPDGEISRELSDFDRVLGVKQSIQDDIGAAVRAGRNNEARELGKVMAELDSALEQSSDMYRTANDGFRQSSQAIDAVDAGAGMSRPSARAADTTQQFQGMPPDQQQSARLGYGDELLRKLEANPSPTANKAKPLQSPKRDAEAQAMTVDPNLYKERLARENEMWETQNRALGGSRTADNQADQQAIEGLSGGVVGALRNSHGVVDMSVKLADALKPLAKGQNEATRELIAKALMSKNPQEALAPALRQDMSSQKMRRIMEAIMRTSGREAYLAGGQ